MKSMKIEDVEKLLACCAEIYRWEKASTFAQHTSQILSRLIDCSVATYQAVNGSPEDEVSLSRPAPEVMEHMDAWNAHVHEHPLINHQRRTNDPRALRMCDVIDRADYHRTALYNEFYRKILMPHQMAVGLSEVPGTVVGLAVSRDGDEFTDVERQMLNIFRMHAREARRQATRHRRQLERSRHLRGMLESLREGIISLNHDLRLITSTRRADELLTKHFPPSAPARRRTLPERIRSWVTQEASSASRGNLHARRRLILATEAGSVRAELIEVDTGWTLVLEECDIQWEATALEGMGLTHREAEILLWICRGKSNPEIAIIVGAGARTVEKHVERILRKLEVESRGAAALRALELLV